MELTRRAVLAGLAGLTGCTALGLAGCQPDYSGLRLTIAAGSNDGVYYPLGEALAGVWAAQLGIPRPPVLQTAGSPANIMLLRTGKADVAFSAADAAADQPDTGRRRIRALARIYDDYGQVVVRGKGPIRSVADLRGKRVVVGAPGSQVVLVAQRLLGVAGLDPATDLTPLSLSLNDSITALGNGTADAFFWSGGLPTAGVTSLARTTPIRVLDLSDLLPAVERRYPVYGTATIPAGTYGLRASVTTLIVPNFLLVTDAMADDVAEALAGGLFDARQALVRANAAAQAIDLQTAIFTSPIPLHPGAEAYYRSAKI